MRGYHETLFLAVHACSRLGARYAPDCEQGAFHDYWISLRGADDTTSPIHAVRSPRKLCAQYARYAVECWYRYWIEQAPGPVILGAHDLLRLCHGLAGAQRAGCIAGAAKDVYDTPVGQLGMCAKLRAADALACVRGVANQGYAGQPKQETRLVDACLRLPAARVQAVRPGSGKPSTWSRTGGLPADASSLRFVPRARSARAGGSGRS